MLLLWLSLCDFGLLGDEVIVYVVVSVRHSVGRPVESPVLSIYVCIRTLFIITSSLRCCTDGADHGGRGLGRAGQIDEGLWHARRPHHAVRCVTVRPLCVL